MQVIRSLLILFLLLSSGLALGSKRQELPNEKHECSEIADPLPIQDEKNHFKDLYGTQLDFSKLPSNYGLCLFFSRKNEDRYQTARERLFTEIYEHPELSLFLIMQRPGTHPMARKKVKKELKESFLEENKHRKQRILEKHPHTQDLPDLFFILDLKGDASRFLGIDPQLKDPAILLLAQDGTTLGFFPASQIEECLNQMKDLGLVSNSHINQPAS